MLKQLFLDSSRVYFVNESQPIEPNSPSESESILQQKAETSTLDGGMQGVVGDNNTQNQSNSHATGNVVNVNVSVSPQAQEASRPSSLEDENREPDLSKGRDILGCSINLVVFGTAVSISLLSIVVTNSIIDNPKNLETGHDTVTINGNGNGNDGNVINGNGNNSLLNSPDYFQLRSLLQAAKWEEADLKTRSVLLRLSDKQEQDVFTERDFEEISCTSLSLIDGLWMKYNDENFGLGIQSHVWEVSGRNYINFSNRVGWLNNGSWSKPQRFSAGGLPRAPWWGIMNKSKGAEAVFDKIRKCRIGHPG
jgi:hypothetical protein